jgi:hypothetical protein
MTKDHANQIRLTANDIIMQLYRAGELEQLEILLQYSQWSVDDLKLKKSEQVEPSLI